VLDVATAAGSLLAAFGLSGAAGLNAWIPLLAVGLLSRAGQLELADGYDVLATTPGLIVLGVLFALDFVGDKVPAIDSLLHAAGTVVHPLAGAIVFAGPTEVPTDVPSLVLFALGASVAGSLHATRATIRPASTTMTAGAGNPFLSLAEDIGAAVLSVVAVFAPILGALGLIVLVAGAGLWWRRIRRSRRRRGLPLLALALAVGAAALALPSLRPDPAPAAFERPSVVVVMTDDQTYQDMAAMPLTRQLIGAAGARFTRSYVSTPLCCPARATYLTGQYGHNSGVVNNAPPEGGVEALDAQHTLPVWLRASGYRTSHIGKYLNGYGLRRPPDVPPGWSDWHGTVDKSTYQMYGYTMFENGMLNRYGNFDVEDPALYQTDVLRTKAVEAIEATDPDTPLFLSLMFVAPHGEVDPPGSTTQPYVRPAPRHAGRFGTLLPPASFRGERDVGDKPSYIRRLHRTNRATATRVLADFRSRRESLLAVDEAIADVVGTLARTGRLDSTYVLFTSDNGFFQGEHRIVKGKYLAYDPASHVPLLIRGPGIAPGAVSKELIVNADLAPTLLEATGSAADIPVDGRSILPFARDPWLRTRRAVLHEGLVPGDIDRDGAPRRHRVPRYRAVRTGRYLWVEWHGGARELYDLARDPGETHSRHRDPRYRRLRRSLHAELQRLRSCAGDACRQPTGPLG